MSSQSYSAPLQSYHVRNLIRILRDANSHYRRVAEQIRESYSPTHHARTRAQKLGLTVNVAKAVACDHRHVSTIPLPIIEQACSPVISLTSSTSLQRPHLSPLVPTVLTKTTPNGTTSAFSAASAYSFVSLASASVPLRDDIGTPMDEDAGCAAEIQHPPVPADVPIDATLIEWSIYDQYMSEGISIKVDDLSMLDSDDSPLSSPSTADSSAGPLTPEVQTLEPITLRVKRKSAEITDYTASDFEKRPKLAREYGWDARIPDHRHIIRIPARRV